MADKRDARQTGLLKGVRKRLFLQRLRSSLSTILLLVSSAILFLLIDVSEGVIGSDHFAYRLCYPPQNSLLTEIMEGFCLLSYLLVAALHQDQVLADLPLLT